MSILINSMNMPKSCMGCDLWLKTSEESGVCVKLGRLVGGKPRYEREKRRDCPLTEVPTPHGRLIDADAFLKWLKEFHPNDVAIMSGIKNARTIVEAEVNE